MKDIVEWLISVEGMAAAFYRAAADAFRNDGELARFLDELAGDEEWHYTVMGDIARGLEAAPGPAPIVSLDAATRSAIEEPFRVCNGRLLEGSAKKNDVIECIAMTEFSEWNDLFRYVIGSIAKDGGKEWERVAARLQQHKHFIEAYLETIPELAASLARFRNLPPLWQARILVVEDTTIVRDLLAKLISRIGVVETARNGEEGLARTNGRFFDVIVSDIDMPVMDGPDFFRNLARVDPGIGSRFLFLTADSYGDATDFLKQNGLRYLVKPAAIADITGAVEDILRRAPRRDGDRT